MAIAAFPRKYRLNLAWNIRVCHHGTTFGVQVSPRVNE
jgi:hypothetical protein